MLEERCVNRSAKSVKKKKQNTRQLLMSYLVIFLSFSLNSVIRSLNHRTFGSSLNNDLRFICHSLEKLCSWTLIQMHLRDWSVFSFLRSPWD